jgi:hypothetical protein
MFVLNEASCLVRKLIQFFRMFVVDLILFTFFHRCECMLEDIGKKNIGLFEITNHVNSARVLIFRM